MGRNGYWVIRTWESGPVGEKVKFWIPGQKPTKSQRRMKQDIRKARQNKEASERMLARLINANFTQGDVLVGLDYSDDAMYRKIMARAEKIKAQRKKTGKAEEEPEAEQLECYRLAAEHELENFILRMQRAAKKRDVELKYIAVTSDMDGETGEMVRVHHHMLMNREAAEIAGEKWKLGGVDQKKLGEQPDYTPIAAYLMQQVRHVPDAKKYKPSRNLIRPVPKDRIAQSDAELRMPAGCSMLQRSEYRPGMSQYIRYILRSRKKDRPRRTKGSEVN